MTRHSITVERAPKSMEAFMSPRDAGTDALRALFTIPGVESPQIITESATHVTLEYSWTGTAQYLETVERLAEHGLRRIK